MDDDAFQRFRAAFARNRWFAPISGGFRQIPIRDTLPTATADLGYRLIAIRGTPDVVYVCLRDSGGDWGWEEVATG